MHSLRLFNLTVAKNICKCRQSNQGNAWGLPCARWHMSSAGRLCVIYGA